MSIKSFQNTLVLFFFLVSYDFIQKENIVKYDLENYESLLN